MMHTSLQGISNRARNYPAHRFGNLYGMLSVANLTECFHLLRKNGAVGVDKIDWYQYASELDTNIENLVERLKRKSYKAKQVKRVYIPKGRKGMRPLGLLVIEDKLLQMCVKRILEAIYEEDFLKVSFGYRPGLGPKDAIENLSMNLQFGVYGWLIDADIKSYFDTIDHDWLIRMLEKRINDGPFIRLIRKWLRAGILDTDGMVIHPATGTPQGGIVSPILANVYLHYALDLWFERKVKPSCSGKVKYIRYADDTIWAFQYRSEAVRCLAELKERLKQFGLELSEKKTRLVHFSRFGIEKGDNDRFDFLGFEYYWDVAYNGKAQVRKRTAASKLRNSLANFRQWCKTSRHTKISELMVTLRRKLQGYWNYYGIQGNGRSLWHYYHSVLQSLYKWLNRRSDRRSYSWDGLYEVLNVFKVPRPKTVQIKMDGNFVFD